MAFGKMESKKFAYQSVYWKIKQNIRDEVYKPGALIPTESELMKLYGVSRTTIRRAVAILADEGFLKVTQGRGTEVIIDMPFHRFESVTHVQEIMSKLPGAATRALELSISEVEVSAEEASVLHLAPGETAYKIQRLRHSGSEVYAVMTNIIPKTLAPNLPQYEGELYNLYPVLRRRYGVNLQAAIEDVSARGADVIEAQILGLEKGAPVLYMVRTAYSNKGPMERAYVTMKADVYKLRMHMNTLPGDEMVETLEPHVDMPDKEA